MLLQHCIITVSVCFAPLSKYALVAWLLGANGKILGKSCVSDSPLSLYFLFGFCHELVGCMAVKITPINIYLIVKGLRLPLRLIRLFELEFFSFVIELILTGRKKCWYSWFAADDGDGRRWYSFWSLFSL